MTTSLQALESQARQIAKLLDNEMNPGGKCEFGFALLMFTFGDPGQPSDVDFERQPRGHDPRG